MKNTMRSNLIHPKTSCTYHATNNFTKITTPKTNNWISSIIIHCENDLSDQHWCEPKKEANYLPNKKNLTFFFGRVTQKSIFFWDKFLHVFSLYSVHYSLFEICEKWVRKEMSIYVIWEKYKSNMTGESISIYGVIQYVL